MNISEVLKPVLGSGQIIMDTAQSLFNGFVSSAKETTETINKVLNNTVGNAVNPIVQDTKKVVKNIEKEVKDFGTSIKNISSKGEEIVQTISIAPLLLGLTILVIFLIMKR